MTCMTYKEVVKLSFKKIFKHFPYENERVKFRNVNRARTSDKVDLRLSI